MAYQPMTDDEVDAFIRRTPPLVPAVSTVRTDGRPHVAPVWVAVDDDGRIRFNTGEATVKGRNLARDPRVMLSFHDHVPPFNMAIVEGTAELVDDLAHVRHWAAVIGGRYMGDHRADEYGRRNGVPGELLVVVTPTKRIAAKDLAE